MEPTESGETFWMLLSLLMLPVEEQLLIIGGLPEEGAPLADAYSRNPASHLLSMMLQYANGWLDEFYPNCPNAEAIYEAVNGGMIFPMSKDEFVNDESWIRLRKMAELALKESGLPLFPVPQKIDFECYIEIVH